MLYGIWFTEGKPANEMVDGGTELTINSSSRWKIKEEVELPARCIPVIANVDVIVAGGVGGIIVAIAAA